MSDPISRERVNLQFIKSEVDNLENIWAKILKTSLQSNFCKWSPLLGSQKTSQLLGKYVVWCTGVGKPGNA